MVICIHVAEKRIYASIWCCKTQDSIATKNMGSGSILPIYINACYWANYLPVVLLSVLIYEIVPNLYNLLRELSELVHIMKLGSS